MPTRKRKRMKRKTTTRTGKVPRYPSLFFLLAVVLTLFPASSAAARKPRQTRTEAPASPALLGGTVFAGAGFALRGAEITVTRKDASATGKERWKALTDARGEYVLRLPAGPATYNVSVRAQGMRPQEKQVEFTAGERLDQNFLLEPATEGGK
jgi:Carboxypeptidase regulatory-like domain